MVIGAVVIAAPAHARADAPRFGVMADVGVPSGAGGSLVYRPIRAVRLHAGGAHNLIAPGVTAGVTVVPFDFPVAPTLVLDGGRFFAGDANAAVERFTGEPMDGVPDRFGYDFASAHLGLEFGSSRATFYLHGGISYVRADMSISEESDDGDVTTMTDADLRAFGPSARLGFIVYLGG